MDRRKCAQDVLRCKLCGTSNPAFYCEVCRFYLCERCVGNHLLDESKDHKVVPFERRKFIPIFPTCSKHIPKQCDLHCEQCNIPICTRCVSSYDHLGHKADDITITFQRKKEILQQDLEELEKSFLPKCQEIVSKIEYQITDINKGFQELSNDIDKRGEDLHREINTIIERNKSEISNMHIKYLAAMDKQESQINNIIAEITHNISDLNNVLDSDDFYLVSAYNSKNDSFRSSVPKLKITFPSFCPQYINKEQLYKQFGSLSAGSITTEHGDLIERPGVTAPPLDRPLLAQPKMLSGTNTRYYCLYRVMCVSDKRMWTIGNSSILKLYNIQGELLDSIKTKSWNVPSDIALSVSEDLVYTDYYDKSVNVIKGNRIQEVIKLWKWRPLNVCSTLSGELLVTLICDDKKQSQIVRYSGSTVKQIIQFDDEGQPLFSTAQLGAICENRNLDICVIDIDVSAVVVVNHAGKIRFKYLGPNSDSNSEDSFDPVGITTDSQSHILIADYDNHRIHIVDQDGQFLCYIDQFDIRHPYGLYVDLRDILYVAEFDRGNVKKIQYLR